MTLALVNQGWIVLRFWEHTIRKELEGCVNDIQEAVDVRKELWQWKRTLATKDKIESGEYHVLDY